ncbi:MAG: uridine kinase [Haliea sp.]|nr:MAG: uridine kinase [Haliea sp.]
MQRQVIAVAAPIGGGKSALVDALAAALGDPAVGPAPTLRFDDYEHATRQSVEQLSQWLDSGADVNQLEAPGLADDLLAWCEGRPIAARGAALTPAQVRTGIETHPVVPGNSPLVFEMPLGRAWSPTARHIDVLVWVDTPLDIALARRLREISADVLQGDPADARRGLGWIHGYLDHYIGTIHAVLQAQRNAVRPGADLVLDGMAGIDSLVDQVMQHLGQAE